MMGALSSLGKALVKMGMPLASTGRGMLSSGVKSGVEFQVNTYTTSNQNDPSVAPLNDGGFAVSWRSSGQDGEAMASTGRGMLAAE